MRDYELLKDLIHFNTVKDEENEQIIDYIEKYLGYKLVISLKRSFL